MVNHVSPYLVTAPISTPVKSNAIGNAVAASTGSGSTAATDIGSTFLNLLVQELQNQDPTNPVDSTAMVGQMISLNQLDQLVSINQEVGGNPGSLSGASTGSNGITSARAALASSTAVSSSALAQPLPLNTTSAQPFFPG